MATYAYCARTYAQTNDSAPVVYRTAASILALCRRGEPWKSCTGCGVVTRFTDDGLVVQDRSAGIYVGYQNPGSFCFRRRGRGGWSRGPRAIRSHDKGAIHSQVGPCSAAPAKGGHFQAAEHRRRDQPIRFHNRRSSVRRTSSDNFWLAEIVAPDRNGGRFCRTYHFLKENADAGSKLVDAVVRVEGAASSTRFRNRQINAPTLFVAGMQSIAVLRPQPRNLFALPLTPISKLMQYRSGTDDHHRVRVGGTVTYFRAAEGLILEDEGRALFVTTAQAPDIKLGDRVEALGFPAPRDSGPIVEDAILRDIAPGQQLQPTPVTIADLSFGSFNYNLVSTEGRFCAVSESHIWGSAVATG